MRQLLDYRAQRHAFSRAGAAWRSVPPAVTSVALLICFTPASASRQELDATPVLDAAAAYIERYERDVIAVTAQEDYHQRVLVDALTRHLRSDMMFIADERQGWIEFRVDVSTDLKDIK
jgi:hypothetical protein